MQTEFILSFQKEIKSPLNLADVRGDGWSHVIIYSTLKDQMRANMANYHTVQLWLDLFHSQ